MSKGRLAHAPGDMMDVWRWDGSAPELLRSIYVGRTDSTGEHVVVCEGPHGPQVLGRGVFDTEVQARWWGVGALEASMLALRWKIQTMEDE